MLDSIARPLHQGVTVIMGILNITPDSFSDGGLFLSVASAVEHAMHLVGEGADIIDIGGESTRPGADPVPEQQELDRVLPVIESLYKKIPVPISIDTTKPKVMAAAIEAGAGMVNDVNALQTKGTLEVLRDTGVPVCLMHMRNSPRTMQKNPQYSDVVVEVKQFLQQRRDACLAYGIKANNIILDPGFGFGKTVEHNLQLLRNLESFQELNCPILVGLSRKSMIGKLIDLPLEQRCDASIALALLAVQNGASIVRVHDVLPTRNVLRMAEAVYPKGSKRRMAYH